MGKDSQLSEDRENFRPQTFCRIQHNNFYISLCIYVATASDK